MIFILNREGTVTNTVTSPVYQGSNANEIVLLAPFAPTNIVTVGFTLPNGLIVQPILTDAGKGTAMTSLPVNDLLLKVGENTETMSAWYCKVGKDITRYSGTLTVQFFIYDTAGDIIASSATTVPVQKGVPVLDGTTFDASTAAQLQKAIDMVLAKIIEAKEGIDANKEMISTLQKDTEKNTEDIKNNEQGIDVLWSGIYALQDDINEINSEIVGIKAHANETDTKIETQLSLLWTLIENTIITKTTVEDNYSSRITAGGLPVVDNAPTTVHRITGDSVSSINLVPMKDMDVTVNGVHIAVESESGTVRINGKPTDSTLPAYAVVSENFYLSEGTYTIYAPNRTMSYVSWMVRDQSGSVIGQISWNAAGGVKSNVFTVTKAGLHHFRLYIPYGDYEALDYLETPMILRGDVTASLPTFAPYYPWLRYAAFSHITSTGRNLITSLVTNSFSSGGVTVTPDAATGTLTINGTPTGTCSGSLSQNFYLPKGTYTVYAPHRSMRFIAFYIRNTSDKSFGGIDWAYDAGRTYGTATITESGYYYLYMFVPSGYSVSFDNYVETPMVIPGAVTENFPDFEMYREDASFALASPVTLRKWDYIDVDAQELVIGTEEIWKADGEPDFTDAELATYPLGSVISADRRVLAYPVETPTTEPITLPKTYKAWRNGMETLYTGDEEAVSPTVTQTYYEEVSKA